jgi:hypothetical protein
MVLALAGERGENRYSMPPAGVAGREGVHDSLEAPHPRWRQDVQDGEGSALPRQLRLGRWGQSLDLDRGL